MKAILGQDTVRKKKNGKKEEGRWGREGTQWRETEGWRRERRELKENEQI